jgi:hypothetical protein
MKIVTRLIPIAILLAAAVLPAAAQAQAYASAQPAPLYPYVAQPGPYAVEVAPGRYVIHRPATSSYPYVDCERDCQGGPAERHAHRRAFDRPTTHNDPALIEELRRREGKKVKRDVVNTTRIVREKPIVIEHQRVVEDPPRVIERRHYVDDQPKRRKRVATVESEVTPAPAHDGKARVIRAEAEVTILGPDRMTIRLFRRRGSNAKAQADKADEK